MKKILPRLIEKGWKLERIPWWKTGYRVDAKTEVLTKTLEYYLGYYYIQEAASMIPPLVLDPKQNEIILDMCAAPGSKTTQIAEMMGNRGVIVANDNNLKRLKALRANLQKLGVMNCVVTYTDARDFWKSGLKFDKILLDVPCSGSGSIVTSWRIMNEWSVRIIKRMSRFQKSLLVAATRCLSKDGILVYSTCSMEPEENEENVDFAVRKLGLEVEKFKIKNLKCREGMLEWDKKYDKSVTNAVRIFPHDNLTEGFFVCKLRK
ncbi:MAG: RsmB/NOP family class I SAM-dependent RNA methyltransferase [Candidatus Aenigmarchaeota archaeon]|nr:RsmB/NOP family class I SAM-dependent RNA methyltransferase [Candidatus Aenigmarchaeota archaeon]